jgi:hypothetical protein
VRDAPAQRVPRRPLPPGCFPRVPGCASVLPPRAFADCCISAEIFHFFADRLARVGFESVCGRTTTGFRRSAALFSFAAEPLCEQEDLVAMPPRFVGNVTRLLGAQSHFLCKATQLLRIDAVGLGLGPSLFRRDP